jgi:hypothetical protein
MPSKRFKWAKPSEMKPARRRKFGGVTFNYRSSWPTKAQAQRDAQLARKYGDRARVVFGEPQWAGGPKDGKGPRYHVYWKPSR